MPATTRTQAVSPGYIYTVTASLEAIVRDVETDKLLCKANNGSQGMFVAIGGTVSITTSDSTATITQASTNSGGARFEVHQTRPDTGEEGVIYLIPITSSTEEENEYEEWIWVKGEWERLGTTGVNLSNYATLTGANTYSGNNTFNGLLLKSNSSSLGDNSVLNRYEADARYGRLDANNTWSGDQYISATGRLTLHPNATMAANSMDVTSLDVANISSSTTPSINVSSSLNIENDYGLHTSTIVANTTNNELAIEAATIVVGGATFGATLSGIQELKYGNNTIDLRQSTDAISIRKNLQFLDNGSCLTINQGIISGVSSLNSGNTKLILNDASKWGHTTLSNDLEIVSSENRLFVGHISGVRSLQNFGVEIRYDDKSVSHGSGAMLVSASEGIKVTSSIISSSPAVTISPSKIEAFQLNADSFGSGKYGLRLTPDSCQLYGIDFAYGDVWSSYPMDGGALPAFLSSDTVKIMKPALTLYTTGVASLAFGEAPKVLFRTFPNGGETAIFEFQSGYWFDDSHSSIATGMVDLRKPSIPIANLHQHSLINKTELVYVVPVATSKIHNNLAIGHNVNLGEPGSIYINPGGSSNNMIGENSIAIGYDSNSADASVAIGSYSEAAIGELNITVGGGYDSDQTGARCSMLLYGGTSYADRDTTGYLKFEVGNTSYADRENSDAQNDTITISKPNLWSALDRAKYRGAQPYASYAASAVSDIPALEPNSITHIYTAADAAIDLSDITLAQHDTAVTTAELWVEVTTAGATITWPDDMLWPDEADPTTAPSFSGPEESTEVGYTAQRLYCVTLRTQPTINIATGNADIPLLIATIAYTLDHKVASASS